jgi:hypothetical protein
MIEVTMMIEVSTAVQITDHHQVDSIMIEITKEIPEA